jgi:anti-sigma factor RsiW
VTCDDLERDLDPYVDRELEPDTTAAIRLHLATCGACRQRVADREALGRLVRTAAPYYPASDDLRSRVSTAATRSRSTQHLLTWAAAASLVFAIGGGLVVVRSIRSVRPASINAIADEVVADHVRSLMADHLFDIRSTDQHTVKPWFLGKLDFAPPVTDLASIGFPLVGGRLEYVARRPAAALVYQRQQHTINVFVWPAADTTTSSNALESVRGFHAQHWTRDGMSFWAVSDLNTAELNEFVRALQQ